MTRWSVPLGLAGLVAALLLAPLIVNQGLVFLIGIAMIEIVFAMSWNLMFSYAGLASFGHAAFFGVGAYTSAAALHHGLGWPFLAVLALGAALSGLFAFIVAIVVLRRASGIQLAVLTLALSQLVVLLIGYSTFLGRDDGLSGIRRPVMSFGLFTVDMGRNLQGYYFIFAVCLGATAVLWWLAHGRRGRAMQAVKIDAERAAFAGINVWRVRVFAFTVAGAFAALAGGLMAPWSQIVAPDTVMWLHSAQPMLATLLGGAGSFWGPILGVLVLVGINYATRTFIGLSEILVGGILLAVVLLAPAGLLGLARQWRGRRLATPAEGP